MKINSLPIEEFLEVRYSDRPLNDREKVYALDKERQTIFSYWSFSHSDAAINQGIARYRLRLLDRIS